MTSDKRVLVTDAGSSSGEGFVAVCDLNGKFLRYLAKVGMALEAAFLNCLFHSCAYPAIPCVWVCECVLCYCKAPCIPSLCGSWALQNPLYCYYIALYLILGSGLHSSIPYTRKWTTQLHPLYQEVDNIAPSLILGSGLHSSVPYARKWTTQLHPLYQEVDYIAPSLILGSGTQLHPLYQEVDYIAPSLILGSRLHSSMPYTRKWTTQLHALYKEVDIAHK